MKILSEQVALGKKVVGVQTARQLVKSYWRAEVAAGNEGDSSRLDNWALSLTIQCGGASQRSDPITQGLASRP